MPDHCATSVRVGRRERAGEPLSFTGYLAVRRFPALDGVRAVAAVAVVLFHFGGPSFAWASGWLGVHVFFVLSGFLITTLALREEERRGALSLRDFYVRRAFRIWPAYFAVLIVLGALFRLRGEFDHRRMGEALPWYVTFNSDIWLGDTLFGHTWTIGIEQKFYLVWPLLAFVPWVRGTRRRLVLMTVVFLTGALLWGSTGDYVIPYLVIAVGCLVAVLMHNRRGYGIVVRLARPVPAFACWAALLGYQLIVPTLVRTAGSESPVILGYGVLVGCVLPSLVALPVTARLLGGRVLRWWGERSYSLYLVQLLAAWAVAALVPFFATPRLLSGAAVVVASALMADLLHRYVELPCITLGKRLTGKPRSSARRGASADVPDVPDVLPSDVVGTVRIPVPGPRGIEAGPVAPALVGSTRRFVGGAWRKAMTGALLLLLVGAALGPSPQAAPLPLMAVYGDSWSGNGYGADGPRGWLALVGAAVGAEPADMAVRGSGYVNWEVGWSFPYTVTVNPVPDAAVTVVFGSLNDWTLAPEATRQAATVTYATIRRNAPATRLLVIGPQWPRGNPPEEMLAHRDAVATAAADAGAAFVDPLAEGWFADRPDLIGADGWHPTLDGQAHLAERIAPHVAAALAAPPADDDVARS